MTFGMEGHGEKLACTGHGGMVGIVLLRRFGIGITPGLSR
jgi:hypothetical protein